MKRKDYARLTLAVVLVLCASVTAFGTGQSEGDGEVTITFWHNYDAGAGQMDVLDDLISQFEAENPGIKVDPVFLEWSSLKDNVVTGATTGVLPDVLRGDIGFVPQFQSLNLLVPLDERFSDYDQVAAHVMAAPNRTAEMGGHFYGLAANTNTKILYYNKAMVPQPPATLDEMWDTAEAVSDDDTIGFCEAWMGGWNVCQYIWSEGGSVLSPDYSTAEGYINSEISVSVISRMAELYAARAFSGPTIDPGAPGDTDGMGTGQYAMTVDGPWKANDLAAKYPDLDFGTALLPRGAAGSVGVLGGEDFMLFETSDDAHQQAAWKFVKFMTSAEPQIAMAEVGQMPVNIDALASPDAIAAMPLLPLFSQALETCRPRPVIPQWSDVSGVINTKTTEAVLGIKSPRQALDEAAAEIDALLSE